MNAYCLITSPHEEGNQAILAEAIEDGIFDNDGDLEVDYLYDYDIKPCLACNGCESGNGCVQDDGFNEIVDKIMEADAFIFMAPIYFSQIAGQAKMVIDRFTSVSLPENRDFNQKKLELIITYSAEQVFYDEYSESIAYIFKTLNFNVDNVIGVGRLGTGNMQFHRRLDEREDIMEQFQELGRNL